jgi:hypothetical protein
LNRIYVEEKKNRQTTTNSNFLNISPTDDLY